MPHSDAAPLQWIQVGVIGTVAAVLLVVMGGVSAGPRAFAGVAIGALFLLTWSIRTLRGARPDDWDLGWLWVWVAVSGWVGLQLMPLPREAFLWIGAYPQDLLQRFPELSVSRVSPHPSATLAFWGMFTTYWATAYLTASLGRPQLDVLVGILVGLIFAEALYGFVAHVGRFEQVLGIWPAPGSNSVVVGTFWNRNHLAGLLAVGWSLGIGYLLFGTGMRPARVHEARYLLVVVFSIAVALALFNTLSRLGTASALFGLLVFGLLARANRVARVSRLERVWLASAGVVALALAISFGLVPLLLRYSVVLEETGRLEALVPLADLPLKTWIAGAGAGAFEEVFKLVQPASLPGLYEYLHNDWAQFVLELGVLGTVAILTALVIWWRRVRPSHFSRLLAAAAAGIAAIGLHSLGDFNLHIPGTAFAFWVVVGILCSRALEREAQAFSAARSATRASRGAHRHGSRSHAGRAPRGARRRSNAAGSHA
jgi:hypothetical protein